MWLNWNTAEVVGLIRTYLGDLGDLGGVDGSAVLSHGHSVPGLLSLLDPLLLPLLPLLISLLLLFSGLCGMGGKYTVFRTEMHISSWLFAGDLFRYIQKMLCNVHF